MAEQYWWHLSAAVQFRGQGSHMTKSCPSWSFGGCCTKCNKRSTNHDGKVPIDWSYSWGGLEALHQAMTTDRLLMTLIVGSYTAYTYSLTYAYIVCDVLACVKNLACTKYNAALQCSVQSRRKWREDMESEMAELQTFYHISMLCEVENCLLNACHVKNLMVSLTVLFFHSLDTLQLFTNCFSFKPSFPNVSLTHCPHPSMVSQTLPCTWLVRDQLFLSGCLLTTLQKILRFMCDVSVYFHIPRWLATHNVKFVALRDWIMPQWAQSQWQFSFEYILAHFL